MIAAYASLALILLLAAIVGQAILTLAEGGRRAAPRPVSFLAPAVGIASLLVIAGIAVRLPGHGLTAAGAIAIVAIVAALWLRRRVSGLGDALRAALPVLLVTALAASLPFLIAGKIGILGAGLVNDDMASHLIIADHVRDPDGYVPTFVRGGYPIGPHALVVGLAEALGAGLVEVFAGFSMALAPVTGLLALALLPAAGTARRTTAASLVALSYLGASTLAMGAFKEPLQALILIAFAIQLGALVGIPGTSGAASPAIAVPPLLRVLPLAMLAAGAVFNYSLPGLLWVGALAAVVIAARFLLVRPRPALPPGWPRRVLPYALGALAVLALATLQEWGRIADFTRLDALNPDRFGSELGNLRRAISPLEALGVWPTGDYRTSATAAGLPAAVFYAGAALGLAALAAGLHEARRSGAWAAPAALLAVVVVWGVTALLSTPYIAAKALAIAAPMVMVVAMRGLLAARGRSALAALGLAFTLAAALSSFLALRQAPVRPAGHSPDLAQVREAVQNEEVLFLGRDNFIAWELRGAEQITGIVTNHYSVEEVRSRFQRGERGGEKFDLDAVFPQTLDRFRFILSPTGGPRSTPPPRFEPVVQTRHYVLWERTGRTGRRRTLDEGIDPGRVLDCDTPAGRRVVRGRGTAQIWTQEPLVLDAGAWSPSAEAEPGRPAMLELELEPGRWLISLSYDSRRPLRVSSPQLGLDDEVVANLDFRGPSPLFPVEEVEVERRTAATITVEVAEMSTIGRLLGAPNQAHLRRLSATPLGVVERVPRRRACGRYVDWYRTR